MSEITDEERSALRARAAENARQIRTRLEAQTLAEAREWVRLIEETAVKHTGMTIDELREAAKALQSYDASPDLSWMFRSRMRSAGAPELHVRNVSRDLIECDALRYVRALMFPPEGAPERDLLVLSGGNGTRKSGSACWALSQVWEGIYLSAPNLLRVRINEPATWERAERRATLVVLDDVGTEQPEEKGAFLTAFNLLVDACYGRMAKLIITTNLTPAQFGAYGQRVVERIVERGSFVTIGGESCRR